MVVFCSPVLGETPVTGEVALSPSYLPSPSSRRLLTQHLSGVRSEVDRIPNRGFKALPEASEPITIVGCAIITPVCSIMKSIEIQRRDWSGIDVATIADHYRTSQTRLVAGQVSAEMRKSWN